MTGRIPLRLIGPNRRRIVTADPMTTEVRKVETLLRGGWEFYDGPAEVDAAGWVIVGTLEPTA